MAPFREKERIMLGGLRTHLSPKMVGARAVEGRVHRANTKLITRRDQGPDSGLSVAHLSALVTQMRDPPGSIAAHPFGDDIGAIALPPIPSEVRRHFFRPPSTATSSSTFSSRSSRSSDDRACSTQLAK